MQVVLFKVVRLFLYVTTAGLLSAVCYSPLYAQHASNILIDHDDTDITTLSQAAIQNAKDRLHVAYGHTSHGSQIPVGMTGLVGFANNGGLGLSLSRDIFAWNEGGTNGALDLRDQFAPGDAGDYTQWPNSTRSYLDAHPEVNVVIWGWCVNELGWYSTNLVTERYLEPMAQLESEYPNVTFVYMTTPSPYDNRMDEHTNFERNNQHIRDFCIANNKVLYDFWDIEHYDPDGTHHAITSDTCNYYSSVGDDIPDGNWCTEWQGSHRQGSDWYLTENQWTHTEHLNCNLKAYAAWALFTQIAVQLDGEDTMPPAAPSGLRTM